MNVQNCAAHPRAAGRWLGVALLPALLPAVLSALLAGCLSRPAPTPPPSVLPAPLRAGAVALSPDGARLAAVNPDSDTVTLVDPSALAVLAEVPAGDDPRTVAFTPDGVRVLVANHGAGSLTIFDAEHPAQAETVALGGRPYGVVAGTGFAYLTLAAPAQVLKLDLAALVVTARLDLAPLEFPTGLALTADQRRLLVSHLYTGAITAIDPQTMQVVGTASAGPRANLAQFVALSPDGTRAYLPHTHSLADNPALTYTTTVQPMLGVYDVAAASFVAGSPLPLAELGPPVSVPFAVAVSPDGRRLYVANAASDDVTVLDPTVPAVLGRWPVGRHPRGLALSPDGARLYVLNTLDGTLDVLDTAAGQRLATLTLTTLDLPPDVLAGKRLFNSSLGPLSQDHWVACAACHLDGGADARTWVGFPDGPRATPALFDAARTLPLHWNGDLDELQDVEQTIRGIQFGAGLAAGALHPSLGAANAGRSAELDALAAYLATLAAPASPYAPSTEAEAQAVARGERAFRRWGCAVCHSAPLFTDQLQHPAELGPDPLARIDTPSLRGVWATAPYFHDGSAPTLRDTLFAQGFHSMGFAMDAAEIEDLLAYLRALPAGDRAAE